MQRKILATIAVLCTTAAIGTSGASSLSENDALRYSNSGISLAQAIATAEQHVGGKATHAEYERHDDHTVIDVEVVKDSAVMDVTVNADNGTLIATRADKPDRNDHGDLED